MGPLQPSHEFGYILTCIDHFTCWPEAISLFLISPLKLLPMHLFRAGYITFNVDTDRGCKFKSTKWNQLIYMQMLGCKRIQTAFYHPAANELLNVLISNILDRFSTICITEFQKLQSWLKVKIFDLSLRLTKVQHHYSLTNAFKLVFSDKTYCKVDF